MLGNIMAIWAGDNCFCSFNDSNNNWSGVTGVSSTKSVNADAIVLKNDCFISSGTWVWNSWMKTLLGVSWCKRHRRNWRAIAPTSPGTYKLLPICQVYVVLPAHLWVENCFQSISFFIKSKKRTLYCIEEFLETWLQPRPAHDELI